MGNESCEHNLAKLPGKGTLVPTREHTNDLLFNRASALMCSAAEPAPACAPDGNQVETRVTCMPVILPRNKQALYDDGRRPVSMALEAPALCVKATPDGVPVLPECFSKGTGKSLSDQPDSFGRPNGFANQLRASHQPQR